MHHHAINVLGRSKIKRVTLTITTCLLRGAGGLAVRSNHRDIRAGDEIRSGPQVAPVATQPLPLGGSPTLQSGGQNQK